MLPLLVTDPGDNFTLRLDGGLPENSVLEKISRNNYIFRWNLQAVTDRSLVFIATDTRDASSTYMPRVEICACKNGGICTLTGVVSDKPTVVMNCQCSEGESYTFYALMYKPLLISWIIAYTGNYCEEDRDGCTEIQCFEGVECTDVPAPGVGANCGPCPQGFTGDSKKCYGL